LPPSTMRWKGKNLDKIYKNDLLLSSFRVIYIHNKREHPEETKGGNNHEKLKRKETEGTFGDCKESDLRHRRERQP
jgi:ribosome-binding ATPase YchF (GTP1/OBG family)